EPLPPPAEAMPKESRKTLTVLFCDVVGSTPLGEQLEPESVRRVMTRFYERMRAVLERHSGRVEKYIGDAVMAVFGLPVLHEGRALSLKGKAEPVTGYRLIDVTPDAGRADHAGPAFVGRERELGILRDAFDRTTKESACLLVTVLGVAGVGKSRLAEEFAASV